MKYYKTMQTFMPFPDFKQSVQALDWRRLGKQRVEALQIINILEGRCTGGWVNHPAVKMWEGYVPALKRYCNACIDEWIARGYRNTMQRYVVRGRCRLPTWMGDYQFHLSHQSNLLRKAPEHYAELFPEVESDLPYIWPL